MGTTEPISDPESGLYQIEGSVFNVASLMQHLAVLIRSMARIGRTDDIELLTEIKKRQIAFHLHLIAVVKNMLRLLP